MGDIVGASRRGMPVGRQVRVYFSEPENQKKGKIEFRQIK
jgi:hypothetical protein